MSKHKGNKKSKGLPNGGNALNEDTLAQLTSRIDHNLAAKNDHKRKNPPTSSSPNQKAKKQRNSDASASKSQDTEEILALLAEIKALGGDEDDLELINGVESEDEHSKEAGAPVDKKLRDELAAFSKQLGFAEVQPVEASDEEDVQHQEEQDDEEDESDDEQESEKIPESKSKRMGNMTFEPRSDWHAYKLAKLPKPFTDDLGPFLGPIGALKQYAQTLLDQDSDKYRTSIFAGASHKFLSTIMSSGTLTDKVSALTLAVQESPVHNVRAYDGLFGLASKKSRGQALGAISALVDLLGPGTLLPSDRRLRTFQNQPGLLGVLQKTGTKTWAYGQPLPGKLSQEHLISFIFEDWLKAAYFKIIQLLEGLCTDEIEHSRMRAVDFIYALLKEKPEQEANLLTLLVNKLGDRERKIASRASYLLLQLQNSHPGMRPIIIRTVEQEILLHPSQDMRSKYYAINTLNQTILSSKEPGVAESLIRIYFDLFIVLLKSGSLGITMERDSDATKVDDGSASKGGRPQGRPPRRGTDRANQSSAPSVPETEAADKLVSALLTGVNRAAPFVGANDTVLEKHLDTLFKIAHSANFNTSIQALLLIQHLSTARALATDRFYRTLYESLFDPRLVTSSKQSLYLNLLLRSLKNDVDVRRVKAFAKRMLQVAGIHQPPFVCGLLYVVAHLRQTFPDLSTLIDEPEESMFDDDEEDKKNRPVYDGRKRNPEHSNAQQSCLWEMIPYQAHFHPSVNVFAEALLDKTKEVKKPDLDSHSLIRFLDKFVYRNPKSTDSARGASIMQPLRATKDTGDIWLGSRGASSGTTQVNSAAFWKKKVEDVAAEDIFFHKYFQDMAKEPKASKPNAAAAEGDEDEEKEEDEIWKALVSTHPDVDGEGSDVGFDDFDEEEMASLDGSSPALSLDDDESDGGVDIEGSDEEAQDQDQDDEDDGLDELIAMDDEDDDEDEDEEEEDEDEDEDQPKEQSRGQKEKARRRMLKNLPTFASVDDYAAMLANDEDEDM